jgi:type III pantothenate kinase
MTAPIADIFCIDAGNTRIKWGWVASDGAVRDAGAVATAQILADGAGLPAVVQGAQIAACSVAGSEAERRITAIYPAVQWLRSSAVAAGITNHYDNPPQLGVDRFAALIGAHAEPCDQLVVMCGTALTVDCLTADGVFLGGVIAPGLSLMRNSLARGTAQLPFAVETVEGFARSTQQAIGTGTLLAALGVVREMATRMADAGYAPRRVLLAGGDAENLIGQFGQRLPTVCQQYLVLQGLGRAVRANGTSARCG